MTTVWNALAVLCLLGTIVFSVLEVRAFLAFMRRARRKDAAPGQSPELWRLVAYSTMAALTLVGFIAFGYMGTILESIL